MRSIRHLARPEKTINTFIYGRTLDYTVGVSNLLNGYLDSKDVAATATPLIKSATAWTDWDRALRSKSNSLHSLLFSTVDDVGRASYSESEVKLQFKALNRAFSTVHEKYPDLGSAIRNIISSTSSTHHKCALSAYEIWSPAYVVPKRYDMMTALRSSVVSEEGDAAAQMALFRCPSLSQPFSVQLGTATAFLDMAGWGTNILASLVDGKTLEGISQTDRSHYDLLQKRLLQQSAVALWLLYTIQPLILHARFIWPLLNAVQEMNLDQYGEDDDLVRRGRRVVEGVRSVADLPLFELWNPAASVPYADIQVDGVFGKRKSLVFPGIYRFNHRWKKNPAGTEAATVLGPMGDIADISSEEDAVASIDGSFFDNIRAVVSSDVLSNKGSHLSLVYCWRAMLNSPFDREATTLDHLLNDGKPWVDWRVVTRVLRNHVGMGKQTDHLCTNLKWKRGGPTNLGTFDIDARGADFSFTDTRHYQKNIWQTALGLTPALPLCNKKSFKYSIDAEKGFGIGGMAVRTSLFSYTGNLGDEDGDRFGERFFIPASGNCGESVDYVSELAQRQPAALRHYRNVLGGLILPEHYDVQPKVNGIQNQEYEYNSWDGALMTSSSVALTRPDKEGVASKIAIQYAGCTPIEDTQFVTRPDGFTQRGVAVIGHRQSTLLINRYGEIRAEVKDPGTVIWDEDSETEVNIGGSSIAAIDALFSFMDDRLRGSSRGGIDNVDGVQLVQG